MWHRPLSEMLTEIVGAVGSVAAAGSQVRTRRVELTLPIEVWLRNTGTETTFIADVPVWRWRTDFDQPSSRLQIICEESQL